MQKLIEKYNRLLTQRKKMYYRDIFKKFALDGRIIGIVGSRGIGKTTFILNLAKRKYGNSEKALYVSADDPYFLRNALIDCAENFVNDYDGKLLLIDEIHRYKNWDQELKNIYDFFPKLKIVFSGSSSINLVRGKYDLSRRAIIYHLNGFSFREFLEYKYGIRLKAYTLEKLIKNRVSISKELLKVPKLSGYFKEYLKIAGKSDIYINIKMDTNEEYTAKIVDKDNELDLALLKIEADQELSNIALTPKTILKAGQKVVTIGYPLQSVLEQFLDDFKPSKSQRRVRWFPVLTAVIP